MYAGFIVEDALVKDLFKNPLHPYTNGLLNSLLRLDKRSEKRLSSIPGIPPDLIYLPKGCPFYQRCEYRIDKCFHENSPLLEKVKKHKVACWVA